MYTRIIKPLSLTLLLAAPFLAACDSNENDDDLAVAEVSPTTAPDSDVRGTVFFEATDDGLRITGTLTGVPPGEHGFHIHENDSCEPADLPEDPDSDPDPAGAAGPHWDPLDTNNHAGPDSTFESRHAGDLGNITAGDDGTVTINILAPDLTIDGNLGVDDHTIMVHSNQDDLTTDPGGNSGMRIGCGIIDEE